MVAARMSTALDPGLALDRELRSAANPFDGSDAHVDRYGLALGRELHHAALLLMVAEYANHHGLALDRELRRAARYFDGGGAISTTSFALHLRSLSQKQ